MMFKARNFIVLVLASFVGINLISSLVITLTVPDAFSSSFLQSFVPRLSFLLVFVLITRYYISTAPERFWIKFVLLALILFSFYAILALAFGDSLLRAMGFEVTPVPPASLLSPEEYRILAFYTYGLSSMVNGLLAVAIAYYLQKYMVRGLLYLLKRITKFRYFIEADTTRGKASFFVYVLWLVLLPFPIQNVISPSPIGVSVLGIGMYLLAALAFFAMLGSGLAALVGITKTKVFRLYNAFREALIWFLAIQWFSSIIYSFLNPPLLVGSLVSTLLLFVRVLFAFGPPALITAYLYKIVFERRAETRVVDYLRQTENMEEARIEVRVDNGKNEVK